MPFASDERQQLLSVSGVGPGVVARLEAAGIESLRQLRQTGVEAVVVRICGQVGTQAWRNRRAALLNVLASGGPP